MNPLEPIRKIDDSYLVLKGYYRGRRARREEAEREEEARRKTITDSIEGIGYDVGYEGGSLTDARDDLKEFWDMRAEEAAEAEGADDAADAAEDREGADEIAELTEGEEGGDEAGETDPGEDDDALDDDEEDI
ncbi:MAG: hypothetical protein AAGH99_00285 [Planctomycetota bacterium]